MPGHVQEMGLVFADDSPDSLFDCLPDIRGCIATALISLLYSNTLWNIAWFLISPYEDFLDTSHGLSFCIESTCDTFFLPIPGIARWFGCCSNECIIEWDRTVDRKYSIIFEDTEAFGKQFLPVEFLIPTVVCGSEWGIPINKVDRFIFDSAHMGQTVATIEAAHLLESRLDLCEYKI